MPKGPDLIELRADFLSEINDIKNVVNLVNSMMDKTDIPLLFTIRSSREGGEEIALNELEVLKLLKEICVRTDVYMIDYEVDNQSQNITELIDCAKKYDKKIILSYHNFKQTPSDDVLIEKVIKMAGLRADHAKIAVMPNKERDVFRLLELTQQLTSEVSIPLTTMSMGEKGKISRSLGWIYGSKITFAVGVKSSAPGQIEIGLLKDGIHAINQII